MNTYLRELTVQFAKFGIVGVIAFCIDYGLFLLMTYVFGTMVPPRSLPSRKCSRSETLPLHLKT